MRGIAKSRAVAWDVRKLSTTALLAVAIALSALTTLRPAAAEDAPKAESAAAPAATVEGASDRGRHHRRKHDDTPKAAESVAKPESAAKADAGAQTPAAAGKIDSSAVAVTKPEQECRDVTPTGSRMYKRICATPEQWKEVDGRGVEGARQTKQTLNDSSAIARPTPPAMPGGGGFAP